VAVGAEGDEIAFGISLRGEPITNTPKVISAIHDSMKLARMVLRTS